MLRTLQATLEGDKLHWKEQPDPLPANRPVDVLVTILNGSGEVSEEQQIRRRLSALQKLSGLNALSDITDPVKWQQETREDRNLPGRES